MDEKIFESVEERGKIHWNDHIFIPQQEEDEENNQNVSKSTPQDVTNYSEEFPKFRGKFRRMTTILIHTAMATNPFLHLVMTWLNLAKSNQWRRFAILQMSVMFVIISIPLPYLHDSPPSPSLLSSIEKSNLGLISSGSGDHHPEPLCKRCLPPHIHQKMGFPWTPRRSPLTRIKTAITLYDGLLIIWSLAIHLSFSFMLGIKLIVGTLYLFFFLFFFFLLLDHYHIHCFLCWSSFWLLLFYFCFVGLFLRGCERFWKWRNWCPAAICSLPWILCS